MKQRAQGASALLGNWSQAEKALQTAGEAEGSALEENSKYLDSINGKLDQMNASFQNLWSNAINSEFIGFMVDAGTAILKLVDNIGMVEIALASVAAVMSFKGAGRANLNSRPHLKMPAINWLIA